MNKMLKSFKQDTVMFFSPQVRGKLTSEYVTSVLSYLSLLLELLSLLLSSFQALPKLLDFII